MQVSSYVGLYFFTILKMTDRQLYRLCKKFGRRALEARRRFVGLLPAVVRRRLYERRGFGSIYEFAAKLGGLGREQVDEVLRLEKRFVDMPVLHQALVRGEVAVSKLVRVAAVARPENAEEILQSVKIYSYAALDIQVREMQREEWQRSSGQERDGGRQIGGQPNVFGDGRSESASAMNGSNGVGNFENKNGLDKPVNGNKSLCAQTLEEFGVSEEIAGRLQELKEKGFDINKLLGELLEKREKGIQEREEKLNEQAGRPKSRYIPVRVRKLLLEKNGRKCQRVNCSKRFEHFHHKEEFARGGGHRPDNLELLCRGHHELEHVRRE